MQHFTYQILFPEQGLQAAWEMQVQMGLGPCAHHFPRTRETPVRESKAAKPLGSGK